VAHNCRESHRLPNDGVPDAQVCQQRRSRLESDSVVADKGGGEIPFAQGLPVW
jgi:hypothetical protein